MSRETDMNNISRRDFVRAASSAAAFAALPPSKAIAAGGQAPAKSMSSVDPMAIVNPELKPALQAMLKAFPFPKGEVTPAQLAALRKMNMGQKPRLQQPSVAERSVPGRGG